MRTVAVATALALGLASISAAADTPASNRQPTHIEAQPLDRALQSLANSRGVVMVYRADLVTALNASALSGDLTLDEALAKLLNGTRLTYKYLDEKTVTIISAASASLKLPDSVSDVLGTPHDPIHVSEADKGARDGVDTLDTATSVSGGVLAEVIVTAQKRTERLQDVPVPVTVLNTEALTQSNQVLLQDYFHKVPGLSLNIGGDGGSTYITIRGITPVGGFAAPVGVVIDDVPYGAILDIGGRGQPDIDPGDLARIEVLRGPQGTLYGANSMGGLLKFVTVDPSTTALSGRVQTGISSLFNGVDPGYNFRGSVNVPVNDTTAFRASGFRQVDGGYIENIQTGQQGTNRHTSEGGRVSMLWKPSEVVSLKLGALFQDTRKDGAEVVVRGPGFADLQERSLINTDTFEQKIQAYSAVLNAKLGGAELTSLTGYNIDHLITATDTSFGYFGNLAYRYITGDNSDFASVRDSVNIDSTVSHHFSEELRLSVPVTDRIRWLIGAFYANERNNFPENFLTANSTTGAPGASLSLLDNRIKYKEYAAFTDVTLDFTDRFNVQFGGRLSQNRQSFDSVRSGAFATEAFLGVLALSNRSKETPFTYLVTPQFKITPDMMVYARLASGYRPGGPNPACTAHTPCQFDSEKTENYEIGFKGDFLDHMVSIDTSVYYIDWKNLQVGGVPDLDNPALTYSVNAGHAKSEGLEFSAEVRPVRGLTTSAWLAWNETKTPGVRFDGFDLLPARRLPFSSRISGGLSADDEFVVSSSLTAFLGATTSYVGERVGNYAGSDFPGYAQTDVHAGVKRDTWTFTAFINNVTDKRGILAGGNDYQYLYPGYPDVKTYSIIKPRIFGLNASKTF